MPYAVFYQNADFEVKYTDFVQRGFLDWNFTLALVGKGDRTSSGAPRSVNDGPKSTVCLGNQTNRAAGQNSGQGDGPAVVGSTVLDRAREGRDLAINDGKAGRVQR